MTTEGINKHSAS